jgi:integrase
MKLYRLNAKSVERAKAGQTLRDGGGLIGLRHQHGTYWTFRFMIDGKSWEMGLGTVSLAEARLQAEDARRKKATGINPKIARDEARKKAALAEARSISFQACAELCIESLKAGWRNERHAKQWPDTLAKHVYPAIGHLPVQEIDTALALKVLEPGWRKITATMDRIRGRCEIVIDFARARDWYSGENPFRWRGHLEHILPSLRDIKPKRHHKALNYEHVGEFMTKLRASRRIGARALELVVMTAVRAEEAVSVRWREFDLDKARWDLPPERTKGNRPHAIPLSTQAVAMLRALPGKHAPDALVFPGQHETMSRVSLLYLARDLGGDVTTHGMRATFRSWAADHGVPRELAEAALHHKLGDETEEAYQRSDYYARRAKVMQSWADFIDRPAEQQQGAEVLEFQRG